jgi:ubiquinone/menaquinone biosynthesis C-methylase UbiE
MIAYPEKVIKALQSRIRHLGAPEYILQSMTMDMLFNLYKMCQKMESEKYFTQLKETEIKMLFEKSRGHVLDLACGIGKVAYTLAYAKPELTILGVDIDAEKMEIAQEIMEGSGLRNLQFQVGNMFELELDQPFETIILRQVISELIEHSEEDYPKRLLDSLFEYLVDDGVILVAETTTAIEFIEKNYKCGKPVPARPVFSIRGGSKDTLFVMEVFPS